MDFSAQIAPFNWIDHEDGEASVTLYANKKFKKKLFKVRKKDGFTGSGYDWESLAQTFLSETTSELQQEFSFDSERGMFCVYSSNLDALKNFILSFKETCENDKLISDYFSRAEPEKPVSKEVMQEVWNRIEEDLKKMSENSEEK